MLGKTVFPIISTLVLALATTVSAQTSAPARILRWRNRRAVRNSQPWWS